MRRFQRFLMAITATLVTAKTGKTPEPMYEIDAVCADWWHPAAESDAPPPTPKPTTALPKGGKADEDEDESDGSAALSLSLATAVAALFAV